MVKYFFNRQRALVREILGIGNGRDLDGSEGEHRGRDFRAKVTKPMQVESVGYLQP